MVIIIMMVKRIGRRVTARGKNSRNGICDYYSFK
jgi:hypothetical protein